MYCCWVAGWLGCHCAHAMRRRREGIGAGTGAAASVSGAGTALGASAEVMLNSAGGLHRTEGSGGVRGTGSRAGRQGVMNVLPMHSDAHLGGDGVPTTMVNEVQLLSLQQTSGVWGGGSAGRV